MNIYPAGYPIERFEVIDLLGEGATAQVYQVRHTALGTEHALKLLTTTRSGLRARLLQEGQVQARLRHANLVAVTDIIEYEGRAGLVMEFIGGASLEQALSHNGKMTAEAALALFLPILSAVEAAHDAGILHRDLKPANILLANTGDGVVPKVTDFGIAKVLNDDGSSGQRGRTRAGLAMGTPGYMAPEQWADSSSVDVRADIFSLGVVLYEILAGRLPYAGDTSLGLLEATMAGIPAPLSVSAPATPAPVVAAITRAIQPDPGARFADVAAFREALLTEAVPAPSPHRRTRRFAWLAGLTGLTAFVGGIGLLALVGAAVMLWKRSIPEAIEVAVNEPVPLGGFSIDRTEVSNAEYQACGLAGACSALRRSDGDTEYRLLDAPSLPVVGVDWEQAGAYCTWRGGRLPTEAEWEQAAARSHQPWPWGGAALSCERANYEGCSAGMPLSTGTMGTGESPAGVRHLIGNVWEWTSTIEKDRRTVLFKPVKRAVLRGGAWSTSAADLKEARYAANKIRISPIYGFRCVY